jgi:hypothetical protein
MNIEVTLWPVCDRLAVLTQAYCRTIVYACWDFELYGLRAPLGAFAMAHATDLLWYFAFAMARRADNSLLYIAKDRAHRLYDLAIAIAFFTCFEFVTRLGCCTFAMTTGIVECEAQICFCAKYGVFKADLYARLDVITAGLLLSATACATAKKATKYIPEAHVPKVKVYILAAPLAAKSTKRIAAAIAPGSTNAGMTKLVVALALLGVLEHLVGLIYFFELRLIATLFVWVEFYRLTAKSLLYLVGAGAFGHTEHFVIITFICHWY